MPRKDPFSVLNLRREFDRITFRYDNNPLLWTSESDYPLQFVSIDSRDPLLDQSIGSPPELIQSQLLGYLDEANVDNQQVLDDLIENALPVSQLLLLHNLFGRYESRRQGVFKQEVAPSTYDLYVLVDLGLYWAGFRTTVIES